VELTRALTALENARMEWNTARLKFSVLAGKASEAMSAAPEAGVSAQPLFGRYSFGELCRMGFALTWPVAVTILLGIGALLILLVRR